MIQDSVGFKSSSVREVMVHFYSYAEFHADPLPRVVGDVCDNGSIIKDGLSDPCAGAGAGAAVSKRLTVTQAAKWGIETSRTTFK
ncbi:MAG TPA: hypothetical protein EYO94_11890 [Acidobacteria bacterium]|nr:hypothetical protein [Acidobacteriota bacterium]